MQLAPSADVTVVLELGRSPDEQVRHAVARCEATRSRLRLLCTVPRTSRWLALAGVDPARMDEDLVRQATALLRRCLESVPANLPTTTQLCFRGAVPT